MKCKNQIYFFEFFLFALESNIYFARRVISIDAGSHHKNI